MKVVELFSGAIKGGPLDWYEHRVAQHPLDVELAAIALISGTPEEQVSDFEVRPWLETIPITQLAEALRRHSPDVVVAHASRELIVAVGLRMLRRISYPIVQMIHSERLLSRRVVQTGVKTSLRAMRPFISDTIAVSSACATRGIGLMFPDLSVIPCSYPVASRVQPLLADRKLIAAGRLVPGKGFESLLRAVHVLQHEMRQQAWQLDIAGDGPLRNHFKRQVTELGIDDLVEFLGHVDAIWNRFGSYHALIMPSQSEGGPLVVPQALAAGSTVVARNVGRCAEWLSTDPESILISRGASSEELAQAIALVCRRFPISSDERQARRARLMELESGPELDKEYYSLLRETVGRASQK